MVKAPRRREDSDEKADESTTPTVTVTNLHRLRPLSFHFGGGSARLGPLEALDLDSRCLASPELAHLEKLGAVRVTRKPAPGDGRAEPRLTTPGEK